MSPPSATEFDRRTETWWRRFAVALFLLLPVDLLTTILAVAEHGLVVESNPFVLWLLRHGLVAVVAANLLAGLLAAGLFHAAVASVRDWPVATRHRAALGVDAWIGLLLATGFFVTANNVLVLT